MKKLATKEFIIGISVICAIVVLFFGVEYLKGINMLSPSNFYYVSYENVSGLEVSAPVTINGYKVGQVRELKYDYAHPGKVQVLLAVNKQLRIPNDSYAVLASTLMSGGYVDIRLGKSSTPYAVGAELPARTIPGLMDALSENVMPAVNTILPRIDSLIMNLNTIVADPALMQSINRLDAITSNIETATAGLDKTMRSDLPAVMGNAKDITVRIDSVSSNLMALSSTLKQLPVAETMDNVNQISANLTKFSAQLNNTTSTLGQLTNDSELYDKLNRVTANIDSLIVDIKKNPKRYISIKLL